jgi:hypothetical protein
MNNNNNIRPHSSSSYLLSNSNSSIISDISSSSSTSSVGCYSDRSDISFNNDKIINNNNNNNNNNRTTTFSSLSDKYNFNKKKLNNKRPKSAILPITNKYHLNNKNLNKKKENPYLDKKKGIVTKYRKPNFIKENKKNVKYCYSGNENNFDKMGKKRVRRREREKNYQLLTRKFNSTQSISRKYNSRSVYNPTPIQYRKENYKNRPRSAQGKVSCK